MSELGSSSNSDDEGIDDGPAPKRRRVPLEEQDEYREYDQPAEKEDESDDSLEFEAGFDEAEEGEGSGDEQPWAQPQQPQQPHGDDDEAEEEGEEEGLADPRLLMKIEDMPGFSKEMMGHDIKPSPASYQTGLSGYWAPWSKTSSPFTPGNEPRPARVLCHTIVSEFIAKDAARIGEWETLSDPAARARQVTSAALLGMLTTGTAKGWTCTDEHTELLQAASQDKDLSEAKAKLNGNVKTYTYKPHANHLGNDQTKRDLVSTQFGWFLEELYSPDKTKVVAIRIFKLIYCASHSDDELWRNLIEETSEITRAGNINAIPEALRKPRMMTQNKLQRTQINDEDLENTASTQWKRIDSMSALTKHLLHHAGAGDGSRGRPLYADMAKETAAGCIDRSLESDKKWGGKHPLGPSVALNFKRFLKPNVKEPGHPGINVAIAGTVDAAGNPLKILPVQCDPNNYFDNDGTFRPPDEVEELGALWACHDNSVKNIFNVPFPRPVHGSVVPDDVLLRAFFDLRKDDDKMLRRTQRGDNPKTFEEVRDIVEVAFNSMATERDAVAAAISKGILNTEMLSYDSMDKTVAEQERLDRRAYEKRNVDKVGEVWVLEPRQVCKDISLEIERIFSMVDEYDKRERVEHARSAKKRSRIQRREDAIVRQKKHCDLVESCIRLGVRRFEHAFASKKLASTIPPGWRDICHTGLRAALKESAEIGVRLAGRNMGRKVDPDHVNAKQGTANMAFAHGQTMVRKDLTPWGHWRCFLTHMLSAGVKIQGDQVRLMLEAWIHAVRMPLFQPKPRVCFFCLANARLCTCLRSLSREPQEGTQTPSKHIAPDAHTACLFRFQEVSFFYLMHAPNSNHHPFEQHDSVDHTRVCGRCGGPGLLLLCNSNPLTNGTLTRCLLHCWQAWASRCAPSASRPSSARAGSPTADRRRCVGKIRTRHL